MVPALQARLPMNPYPEPGGQGMQYVPGQQAYHSPAQVPRNVDVNGARGNDATTYNTPQPPTAAYGRGPNDLESSALSSNVPQSAYLQPATFQPSEARDASASRRPPSTGLPPTSNGLPPTSNGLPPTSNGLPPTSNGLPQRGSWQQQQVEIRGGPAPAAMATYAQRPPTRRPAYERNYAPPRPPADNERTAVEISGADRTFSLMCPSRAAAAPLADVDA
eukprot:scaffold2444_cov130-Pinguiococcus_pyrenoidosus.AAC.1